MNENCKGCQATSLLCSFRSNEKENLCPCGLCLVKVTCIMFCERYYVVKNKVFRGSYTEGGI